MHAHQRHARTEREQHLGRGEAGVRRREKGSRKRGLSRSLFRPSPLLHANELPVIAALEHLGAAVIADELSHSLASCCRKAP